MTDPRLAAPAYSGTDEPRFIIGAVENSRLKDDLKQLDVMLTRLEGLRGDMPRPSLAEALLADVLYHLAEAQDLIVQLQAVKEGE